MSLALDPGEDASLDESRTQGFDRLEPIRFLQVAQTLTVHHGALAYLLGIEDYADTLRGYRVLHLVGKGNKPATMPLTVPVLRVLEACRGERASGPLILRPLSGNPVDRRDVYRMVARIAKTAGIARQISPPSLCTPPPLTPSMMGSRYAMPRSSPGMPTPEPPSTTTAPAAPSTGMPSTSSPPTSPASDPPSHVHQLRPL